MNEEILKKLENYEMIVGIDEVGRGPIAGPVTVAAFGITKKYYNEVLEKLLGITDSKKLTEKKREYYADIIRVLKKEKKLDIALFSVSAKDIDDKGIVAALSTALSRSVHKITFGKKKPYIYLDGSLCADKKYQQETIIKGDSKNWLIGAASVVAKVARDTQMKELDLVYPNYGFEKHKGYGTKAHYLAIQKNGVCEIHRKTWIKS